MRWHRPDMYQERNGTRQRVAGRYVHAVTDLYAVASLGGSARHIASNVWSAPGFSAEGSSMRLHVRGKENVHKRLLLQAAACNLALLLRKMVGVGTPRAMQDAVAHLLLVLLQRISALDALNKPTRSLPVVMALNAASTPLHSTGARW